MALNGFSFSAFAWARATHFLQGLCCGHQPGAAGTQLGWQVQPGVALFLTGAMLLVGLNASHPRLLWVCKHGHLLCSACSRCCGVHSDFLAWGMKCFWSLCCAHAGGGVFGTCHDDACQYYRWIPGLICLVTDSSLCLWVRTKLQTPVPTMCPCVYSLTQC